MKTTFAFLTLSLAIAAAATVATSLASTAPFDPMILVSFISSFASAGLIAIISADYAREPAPIPARVRKPVAKTEPDLQSIDTATCHTFSA
jgi:hypothetical protein